MPLRNQSLANQKVGKTITRPSNISFLGRLAIMLGHLMFELLSFFSRVNKIVCSPWWATILTIDQSIEGLSFGCDPRIKNDSCSWRMSMVFLYVIDPMEI